MPFPQGHRSLQPAAKIRQIPFGRIIHPDHPLFQFSPTKNAGIYLPADPALLVLIVIRSITCNVRMTAHATLLSNRYTDFPISYKRQDITGACPRYM